MPSVRQSSRMVWSKVPGCTAALKSVTVFSSAAGSSSSLPASSAIVGALDRRKQRRHEAVATLTIEDDVGDLVGLRGHQPAPDRVALRPDVLALVIEALGVLVDDDAEHHRVVPRDDAAVEFRRAGVDRDRMALGGIADVLHALVEQQLQDRAAVIGRAADQEIVGRLAPIFLQPFDVGLKTAGRRHQRRGADFARAIDRLLQLGGQETCRPRSGGRSPRRRRRSRRRVFRR